MAYDKDKLYQQAKEAIEKHNLYLILILRRIRNLKTTSNDSNHSHKENSK